MMGSNIMNKNYNIMLGRASLGIAVLNLASCAVDGFVNNPTCRSSLSPFSYASVTSFKRNRDGTHAPIVGISMLPSFPEDASKSADYDASSQSPISENGPVGDTDINAGFASPDDNFGEHNEYYHDIEFMLSNDMEVPSSRKIRWEKEAEFQNRFKSGDDLYELRQKIASLRVDLRDAKKQRDSIRRYPTKEKLDSAEKRVKELELAISLRCQQDAEFWYAFMLEVSEGAERRGDFDTAKQTKLDAEEARQCVPQLNMHGLWVGKYGDHGYEMINVTYVGDTLIATKVTGDQNVPCGEMSFTCNLSPRLQFQSLVPSLEPIELNARAARQWGKRYLPRHPGKGQVASEGYRNAQWLDGQLILVGRFFSFAWVPIGHQVFFGRPSPELVLKMLKEQRDEELKKDPVAVMRQVAQNMMDDTYSSEDDTKVFIQEGGFE